MRLSRRTLDQIDSPISAADALVAGRGNDIDLLDLAQAAPQYAPSPDVIEHVVRIARDEHGGADTDVPGLPALRRTFA